MMLPRAVPGDPGTEWPLVIDGYVFSFAPQPSDMQPDPITTRQDLLSGEGLSWQHRPGFDGIADRINRYVFSIPFTYIKGPDLVMMELFAVRAGSRRVTIWRYIPMEFTLISGVQTYYFPQHRKCAPHLYSGLVMPRVVVSTEVFPTLATITIDDEETALSVTYAEGPTLVSPGAGGIVIARQPEVSGEKRDRTPMLLGDAAVDGARLTLWSICTFETNMEAPSISMSGLTESQSHRFVEV